jgi:hypothetical protein
MNYLLQNIALLSLYFLRLLFEINLHLVIYLLYLLYLLCSAYINVVPYARCSTCLHIK